jgi:uncharacterized protein (TIGR03790 family)
LDIAADSYPLIVGVANYATRRWELSTVNAPGSYPLTGGVALVDAGISHILVAVPGAEAREVTELTLHTNTDLIGDPTAQVNLLGTAVAGVAVQFNALGSDPGDYAYTSFRWSAAGQQVTTFAPEQAATFVFDGTEPVTVELEVQTTGGRTAADSNTITDFSEPMTDVLVVYNSDITEDEELAEYYMSAITGHGIPVAYKLGLALGDYSDTISREDYGTLIREPIKAFLDDAANADVAANVKYLLLLKGLPHRIPGVSEFDTGASTFSSVDSELCCLYSDDGGADGYPIESWLWNSPVYEDFGGSGFYLAEDEGFTARTFQVSDSTNTTYTLDYLVGRLSAYTYDEARLLVDRALSADTSGSGWVVFDSCEPRQGLDTMVDPVWPWTTNVIDSGIELLSGAGMNAFADITPTRIISTSDELPGGFTNSIIGYAGWGVNHTGGSYANGNEYILEDLNWNYLPGACWMSYESFNGTDLDDANGIGRRGQGQIADFLRRGGSVAIGNAYEPFTIGVGDERWVFDRYLVHGDRWIEAAYKGLRLLSWQEIVVGDPLCRVVE